jgi:hypothetical protein
MRFLITTVSNKIEDYLLFLTEYQFVYRKETQSQGYIFIESLEDLLRLKANIGRELILTTDHEDNPSIEIYDDYRE